MLRNCDTRHYMENKGRMGCASQNTSRDCLERAAFLGTGSEYEGRQGGTLQLFVPRNGMKTRPAISPCLKMRRTLSAAGSQPTQVEPALAEVAHKVTGGLRLPNDETGDCQSFHQRLARM